ncbi:MAG: hypothetical protein JKY84_10465 [Emcibacteraceae bacterium]|nr:hypothetical protein [Emcibacteraceae bacterium]
MIDILCDTILPGDEDLGLPSGAIIDIDRYIHRADIGAQVKEYGQLLDELSLEKFNEGFVALDVGLRLEIVELSRRRNNRLSNIIIIHCMKAYYTDANVLKWLPAGAVPPFPAGNPLKEDDWSLLEPVYERGQAYRPVSP